MNVDFMAIGGTAWTVAGSIVVACMICNDVSWASIETDVT